MTLLSIYHTLKNKYMHQNTLGDKIKALDKRIEKLQAKIATQGEKPDESLLKTLEGYQCTQNQHAEALYRPHFNFMQPGHELSQQVTTPPVRRGK